MKFPFIYIGRVTPEKLLMLFIFFILFLIGKYWMKKRKEKQKEDLLKGEVILVVKCRIVSAFDKLLAKETIVAEEGVEADVVLLSDRIAFATGLKNSFPVVLLNNILEIRMEEVASTDVLYIKHSVPAEIKRKYLTIYAEFYLVGEKNSLLRMNKFIEGKREELKQ